MNTKTSEVLKEENKNNNKFARFSLLCTMFNYGSKFLVTLFLAKELGFENFGIISIVIAIVFLVEKLFNPQIWLYLINQTSGEYSNRNLEKVKESMAFEFSFKACATILYFSIILFIQPKFFELYLIFGAYIPASVHGTALGIVRMKSDYKTLVVANLTVAILNGSIILSGVLSPDLWNKTSVISGLLIVELSFFFLIMYRAGIFIPKILNLTIFKLLTLKAAKQIFTFHQNAAIRVLTRELDIILVGLFFNNHTVGVYKIAKQLVHLPLFVTDGLYNAVYPSFCKFQIMSERHILVKSLLVNNLKI
jgi:O-antigen/teichoic acid export membrane protein